MEFQFSDAIFRLLTIIRIRWYTRIRTFEHWTNLKFCRGHFQREAHVKSDSLAFQTCLVSHKRNLAPAAAISCKYVAHHLGNRLIRLDSPTDTGKSSISTTSRLDKSCRNFRFSGLLIAFETGLDTKKLVLVRVAVAHQLHYGMSWWGF